MVDDTNYITPHEAALAVVATSMKKARLHISTLIINSIMGGVLFCSGSMLFVMIHSNSPGIEANNPGMLDILGGISYGIGLFFVVVMGVDLYNSNILFFSVGVLRRAVTIWDLLISWFVSLFGNLAGALFMSYVLAHLSTVSTSKMVVATSIEIGEAKAHPSFIQVFLKGIGGNIYVCLAIYLQLMAKPLHVKLLMLILPVFTFVTIGFSHTIADMGVMFIAMLNGAHVTVAQYIWKVLIPTALGNAVGGFAFSLVLPFYLHLEVVEHDRKKLALPTYEARDEQPELNMDSRVVRITSKEHKEFADVNDAEEDESITPITSTTVSGYNNSDGTNLKQRTTPVHPINTQYHSDSMSNLSASLYSNNVDMEFEKPQAFIPNAKTDESNKLLRRYTTISKDGRRHIRSPPGVFPVRGMGTPLTKERTIEDPTNFDDELDSVNTTDNMTHEGLLSRIQTNQTNKSNLSKKIRTLEREEQDDYGLNGGYNVEDSKPSAQLGKVLSRIMSTKHNTTTHHGTPHDLESGLTQETFPFNKPDKVATYDNSSASESSLGAVLKETFSNKRKSFREAGITDRVAMMANNTAGEDNYTPLDIAQHDRSRRSSRSLSGISHVRSRAGQNLENSCNKSQDIPPTEADKFETQHDGSSDAIGSNKTTSNKGNEV